MQQLLLMDKNQSYLTQVESTINYAFQLFDFDSNRIYYPPEKTLLDQKRNGCKINQQMHRNEY